MRILTKVRGGELKSGLFCKNPLVLAKISFTKTYYIPNQWKFNEKFTELHKCHIAALIEGDNLV